MLLTCNDRITKYTFHPLHRDLPAKKRQEMPRQILYIKTDTV